jgi:hypothetical protein
MMTIEEMKQWLEALEGMASDLCKFESEVPAIAAVRQAIAEAEQQKPITIPEGFTLVAVKGFRDLMYWLDRCDDKGHLENCPDLIEPYHSLEYRTIDTHPQPRKPLTVHDIGEICKQQNWFFSERVLHMVRVFEAAHGIKENT